MNLPDAYYVELRDSYIAKRNLILPVLREAGFLPFTPHGAYYVMCDITSFGCNSDVEFARLLVEQRGLAVVPGSSFFSDASSGRHLVRFAFPKRLETLQAVAPRLEGIRSALSSAPLA
jgi:aminotransferase